MAGPAVTTSPLLEYCLGAVNALKAQYEMTKVVGHSATAGAAREGIVQAFLTDHLPEMATVVSGVIVDARGNRSKQQDIVLMLKSMPRLRFAGGHDLIFQEGAIATFEIKTAITARGVVGEIGENIRSVRNLVPTSLAGARMGDLSWEHARILTVVLTYEGTGLSTIAEWLENTPESDQPDLYLDLSKGLVAKNYESFELAGDDTLRYIIVENAALGLARFLAILAKITGVVQTREVKWSTYIG